MKQRSTSRVGESVIRPTTKCVYQKFGVYKEGARRKLSREEKIFPEFGTSKCMNKGVLVR